MSQLEIKGTARKRSASDKRSHSARVQTSSARTGAGRDDWSTPIELVEEVERTCSVVFVLDCACESHNAVTMAPRRPDSFGEGYHHDRGADGLQGAWCADVGRIARRPMGWPWEVVPRSTTAAAWLQPPYSQCGRWFRKARKEARAGASIVALVPARVDTRWFQDHIASARDDVRPDGERVTVHVRFLVGRVAFGDGATPAPFPVMLVAYNVPAMPTGVSWWEPYAGRQLDLFAWS